MKTKQYLHTNFVKFLVEKYGKKVQDEKTDLPLDVVVTDDEKMEDDETEDNEPIEDLIAEYRDLYKKFEGKKYDAIFKRQ